MFSGLSTSTHAARSSGHGARQKLTTQSKTMDSNNSGMAACGSIRPMGTKLKSGWHAWRHTMTASVSSSHARKRQRGLIASGRVLPPCCSSRAVSPSVTLTGEGPELRREHHRVSSPMGNRTSNDSKRAAYLGASWRSNVQAQPPPSESNPTNTQKP